MSSKLRKPEKGLVVLILGTSLLLGLADIRWDYYSREIVGCVPPRRRETGGGEWSLLNSFDNLFYLVKLIFVTVRANR